MHVHTMISSQCRSMVQRDLQQVQGIILYRTIHTSRYCVINFFTGQGRFYGVADRHVFLFCQPNFGRNYYPQRYLSSSTLTYLRSKTHDVLKKSMQRYGRNRYSEIKILHWQNFTINMIISDLGSTLSTTTIYLLSVDNVLNKNKYLLRNLKV